MRFTKRAMQIRAAREAGEREALKALTLGEKTTPPANPPADTLAYTLVAVNPIDQYHWFDLGEATGLPAALTLAAAWRRAGRLSRYQIEVYEGTRAKGVQRRAAILPELE